MLEQWPVEHIPDSGALYMAVHQQWFKPDGTIIPRAFQNHGTGMSTDWSRYSTPEETRNRRRTPSANAVVQLIVADIHQISGQRVQHAPLSENRAHTDVTGEKDEEARVLLRRAARIILPLPPKDF